MSGLLVGLLILKLRNKVNVLVFGTDVTTSLLSKLEHVSEVQFLVRVKADVQLRALFYLQLNLFDLWLAARQR